MTDMEEPDMLCGQHLIAGDWVDSGATFTSDPATGEATEFSVGTPELVDRAVRAAEAAFAPYSALPREARAAFLDEIATQIEARGADITAIGTAETGLPAARLDGERARTTGQLRLFAAHIRDGAYLDRRHDPALPDRAPLPRPDLRMVQRPIGPVGVFGASNFPLAFSVAGGDTASALAAGCPVIVKGHSAHPGTSEIVAQAIADAITACDVPQGVFSLIQGGRRDVGEALVSTRCFAPSASPARSPGGGRCSISAQPGPSRSPSSGNSGRSTRSSCCRPPPRRGPDIAAGWAGSLTMGAGQFCTNPGVVFIADGAEADAFAAAAASALDEVPEQTMLTDGIALAYRKGVERVETAGDLVRHLGSACDGRAARPYLFETSLAVWQDAPDLAEEVFGPLGLIVRVPRAGDFGEVARTMEGQLTCTLHLEDADIPLAAEGAAPGPRTQGRAPSGERISHRGRGL